MNKGDEKKGGRGAIGARGKENVGQSMMAGGSKKRNIFVKKQRERRIIDICGANLIKNNEYCQIFIKFTH